VKIALIGDSQSEALWPRVQKALPQHTFSLVRTQRGWSELNYMKEGKLAQQLEDAKPDLVVIELGGNNATLSNEKYQSYVDWMLKAARESGARKIIYYGPAAATKEPFKSNKEWTRAFQKQYLSSQPSVVWYDNFPYTQTGQVDGVHFSAKTYDPWSKVIAGHIEQNAPTGLSLATLKRPVVLLSGVALLLSVLLLAGVRRRRRPS
jgi:lysophospholipase L1-like esterase